MIGILFPHIIGVRYETTAAALLGQIGLAEAIMVAVVKALGMAITPGGWMGGGVFSPALPEASTPSPVEPPSGQQPCEPRLPLSD
ncbi:hypothetical protein E4191_03755 [Paracoccus liaowanqingii]|uniref:Uncharacterized protein n=2 Tax=Paracoccus liaowanqingii TaxID=2560053 RepID=A0A4P7HJZ3_9RHOB|nr:hypothetical protein E4191_03755 [Paracoccus liaowanqingii]